MSFRRLKSSVRQSPLDGIEKIAAHGVELRWVRKEKCMMASANVRVITARVLFKAPGQQINGLEAVPEGLWLSDQRDNYSYLIDYEGRMRTSFPGPARNASGTSAGAGSVWVASNVRPAMIFRHDQETGYCTACLVLAGEGGVHGLQWRPYAPGEAIPARVERGPELHPTAPGGQLNAGPGISGTLWVTRPGAHRIDHIDAETGDLLGSIPFQPDRSHGMFWDEGDDSLCVAETNGGHILRLDPQTGAVREEWHVAGPEVHAMTRSADGRIWIGDASTNEILILDL
jgi:streptogramin lyase